MKKIYIYRNKTNNFSNTMEIALFFPSDITYAGKILLAFQEEFIK